MPNLAPGDRESVDIGAQLALTSAPSAALLLTRPLYEVFEARAKLEVYVDEWTRIEDERTAAMVGEQAVALGWEWRRQLESRLEEQRQLVRVTMNHLMAT